MQKKIPMCRMMLLVFGLIISLVAGAPAWAAISPTQWNATWEKTGSALEDAIKNTKLRKQVQKAGVSSKIGTRLTKLENLNEAYNAARDKFFRSNSPKDLKKWKNVLKQFSKEMRGLAKAKDKYIGSMKKIFKNIR